MRYQDWGDRSTQELMETLVDDVERCHRQLIAAMEAGSKRPDGTIDAEYEFEARQLIRAIFALIEATTFSVKLKAVEHALDHEVRVTDAERFFALEVRYDLDDNGTVVERPATINLARNLRFTFAIHERAHKRTTPKFDPRAKWWSSLQKSIKVRDRITHPRIPSDVDISPDEIITALDAYKGFTELLVDYIKDA